MQRFQTWLIVLGPTFTLSVLAVSARSTMLCQGVQVGMLQIHTCICKSTLKLLNLEGCKEAVS